MIERVGHDRVVGAEQGLEDGTVGVEAGGERDRVFGVQEVGDRPLQGAMGVEGAADEADRGHAIAVLDHRLSARSNEGGVVGESEIVVGTEIEDLASAVDLHPTALGRRDQALGLPESVSRIWSRVVSIWS